MSADIRPSDEWIDETARALTEGEPSSGFKARVLARIDGAGSSPRFAWGRLAIASGAIAAIVLAVVVSRDATKTAREVATAAGDIHLNADGTGEVRLTASAEATAVKKRDVTTDVRLKAVATRAVRLKPDTTPEIDLPAMENAPPPIEVADIEMRSLEIAAVDELDPVVSNDLTIDSIELAPLTTQFD